MKILLKLGITRGLIAQIVGTAAGIGLVAGIRLLMGLPATTDGVGLAAWEPHAVAGAAIGVICFMAGVGALTDWWKWAMGDETEEHHGPDPRGWERYFGVSLDHKVIGIQYGVTSVALLLTAGSFALTFRTELAASGMQFLSTGLYNTLMGLHGIVMIAAILLGVGAMS
ncbi:MAG TPA: cytochrome C oxidase subunit I, partial [Anaerolineales bacterium]|nr:cytochrome C oxidase subunit I [Anaerolineales bacterium]